MGRKKGAKQNDWCVYKKEYNGELYEKNEARYPLPQIGDYVIIWRRRENYKRGYGKDGDVIGVWELDDNCLDALNRPLVYQVKEYKLGIDKPTARGNSVYLESGGIRGYVTYKKWIDTISISNGYYHLEVRPNARQVYDSQDVFCHDSKKQIPAEYVPSKEKALRQKEKEDKKNP